MDSEWIPFFSQPKSSTTRSRRREVGPHLRRSIRLPLPLLLHSPTDSGRLFLPSENQRLRRNRNSMGPPHPPLSISSRRFVFRSSRFRDNSVKWWFRRSARSMYIRDIILSPKFRSLFDNARAEMKEGKRLHLTFLERHFLLKTNARMEEIFLFDVHWHLDLWFLYTICVSPKEYFGRHQTFFVDTLPFWLLQVLLIPLRGSFKGDSDFFDFLSGGKILFHRFRLELATRNNVDGMQLLYVVARNSIENKNRTHLRKFIILIKTNTL